MVRPISAVGVEADTLYEEVTYLAGWAFVAQSAKLIVELREGAADGRLLGVAGVAAQGDCTVACLPPGSVPCPAGVYVAVTSGNLDAGVIYGG